LLVKRVSSEAGNAARIRKAYSLVFGRPPAEAELNAGLEYLKREPLQEYEERKLEKEKKEAEAKRTKDAKSGPSDAMPATAARPPGSGQTPKSGSDSGIVADGMMAGVTPGASKPADEPKLLPPTAWGRYIKILLSSGEFIYVN
jgi:hypothetical protein